MIRMKSASPTRSTSTLMEPVSWPLLRLPTSGSRLTLIGCTSSRNPATVSVHFGEVCDPIGCGAGWNCLRVADGMAYFTCQRPR